MSVPRNAPGRERRNAHLISIREQHMVRCEACGAHWDEWEQGIPLSEALARIERRQRRFFGTMRRLLAEGAPLSVIAAELAERYYGAEAVYVRKN